MPDLLRSVVVGWLVALVVIVGGCLHGMAALTPEQTKGLAEAQRIADQVTKGYGVPSVRVYAMGLDPGTDGTYAHHND